MDDNKNAINPEEASEMQKESEAELQAELDNGDTDIFEPKSEGANEQNSSE